MSKQSRTEPAQNAADRAPIIETDSWSADVPIAQGVHQIDKMLWETKAAA